ncbi:GumC family protein [Qipengyuania sp. DSG2-2]|uniref:GumC family protein n=1 Tax=Qipengyuania sp. DGS2-2 TaxID=3349631 RepID=UPI0036D2141E
MNQAQSVVPSGRPSGEGTNDSVLLAGGAPSGSDNEGGLFDFVELRAIVMRNIWLILGSVVTMLIVAAILTALTVPLFRAETTLQVDPQQANILDVEDVQADVQSRDTDQFLQTQIEILESRSIAEDVAEDLGLLDDNAFLLAMNRAAPSGEGDEAATQTNRTAAVVAAIMANRRVARVPDSQIVEIEFVSPSPRLSTEIANSLAENYIEDSLTRRFSVNNYAREFVGEQLAEARERLENSEKVLATYAQNAGIVTTARNAEGDSTGSLTGATIEQTNELLIRAKADRIEAEQAWQSARSSPALALPSVYQNPAITNLLRRRAELRGELAELNERYVDGAPEVQEVRAELAEIDREVSSISGSIKSSLRKEYEARLGRERELSQEVAELTGQQQGEQTRGVQYNILAREVATNRSLYDGLLQRFRELTASAGLTGNSITIVDEAQLPRNPFAPQPVRNMAIGLLVGLVLAGLLTMLREQIFNRVRTPEDIRRHLSVPLLSTIPKPHDGDMKAAMEENLSGVSEAFQTLTSILSLSSDTGAPRSMFITSGRSSEGKSTTAFAVAKYLARRGKRVLIVDADLRRPQMHRLVDSQNEVGLSDLLAGQTDTSSIVHSATEFNGLSYVTAGPIPPDPVDLLSSARLKAAIAEWREQFDHVIVDGPPVLGLSDALIISSNVDATVFALESGAWRPGQVKDMLRRLSNHANQLVGIVMTKFDAKSDGYAYYYQEYEYSYSER